MNDTCEDCDEYETFLRAAKEACKYYDPADLPIEIAEPPETE